MTEVDYGYEQTDYGYDTTAPSDYGSGDQTDYGYGPQTDYGYGEQADYGYSEQTDYGYGDARPDDDSGEPKPEAAAPRKKQVKRRCSVTKFSLDEGAQEVNKAQQDLRNMVDMLRQGATPPAPVQETAFSLPPEQAPVEAPDEKSFAEVTAGTTSCDSSFDGEGFSKSVHAQDLEKKAKKGMMSRMRKRLSVFH
jgi:hypothetical protein